MRLVVLLALAATALLPACSALERARAPYWELSSEPTGQAPDPATTPEERRGIEDEHDVRFVLLRTDRRDRTLLAGLRAEGATVVAEDDGRILLHVPPPLQPVFDE